MKILDTLFGLIQIDVQWSNNCFQICLPQEVGAFGNNIEAEPQKPRPKLKNMFVIYLQRIFALPGIRCKW